MRRKHSATKVRWTFEILQDLKEDIGGVCTALRIRTVSLGVDLYVKVDVVIYLFTILKYDYFVNTEDRRSASNSSCKLGFKFKCLCTNVVSA